MHSNNKERNKQHKTKNRHSYSSYNSIFVLLPNFIFSYFFFFFFFGGVGGWGGVGCAVCTVQNDVCGVDQCPCSVVCPVSVSDGFFLSHQQGMHAATSGRHGRDCLNSDVCPEYDAFVLSHQQQVMHTAVREWHGGDCLHSDVCPKYDAFVLSHQQQVMHTAVRQ